jgi:hypothetical protein
LDILELKQSPRNRCFNGLEKVYKTVVWRCTCMARDKREPEQGGQQQDRTPTTESTRNNLGRRTYIKTIGAATGGLALGGMNGTATPTSNLPQLHTEGNAIVTENGDQITLRGVNIVDPQLAAEQRSGIDVLINRVTDQTNGWHTDVIRLPVHASRYLADPDNYVSQYLTPAVNACAAAGAYCIVDWHRIEDYNTDQIDQETRAFWDHVAPIYADQPHVLYELFNEPIGPNTWDEDWATWKTVAQPWVDLIRSHAPKTPIIVGSPHWSQFTQYAADDPFTGDNLIYTAHIYPAIKQSEWEEKFGAPAESVPVFVTEWGYENSPDIQWVIQSTTSEFGKPFRSFVKSHPTMSWCAWNYDHIWQPVMVDSNYNLLGGNDYMGEFAKSWLADAAKSTSPETHTLVIDGSSSPDTLNRYSFSVTESVEKSTDLGSIQANDTISGTDISGEVLGGKDGYNITGDISNFTVDGSPTIYFDRNEVSPADLGDTTYPNTLVVDGSPDPDATGNYEVTVSGKLKKSSTLGSVQTNDTISGATASGSVYTSKDGYRFTGNVTELVADGHLAISLTDDNTDTPATDSLPNSVIVDGSTSPGTGASYSLTVTGDIEKSSALGSVQANDTISGSTASGSVYDGTDGFVYSGEITAIEIEGNATLRFEDIDG